MNSGFKSQAVPSYRVLTQEQIEEIHRASLDLLETAGVRILNDEGVQLLRDAGCRVKGDNTVLFPGWLVEDCIRSAPSRILVYNRKGEEAMRLEGRNIYFGMGTDLITTLDMKTGKYRPTVLQDVVNAVKVADACSEIDFVSSLGLASDVPTNAMYVESVKAELENTTKPLMFTAAGEEDLAYIFKMAAAVVGGEDALREKPCLVHYSEPTPPLTQSYGAVRKLFLCADRGIPILYPPGMTMGGTGPITLAGGLVLGNADALAGVVLHQLRHKGSPIVSGFAAVPLDMGAATFCYGAPEFRLTNSAMADIYHYYGIPMWSTTGTDAHAFDQQASWEHAIAIFMAALDGANLIHDIGYLGQGLISYPPCLVMCNEIISYVKRILRGFDLTPEKMGLDTIREVGPGGNFMAEMHTVKNFRQEQWRVQFMNRDEPDTWEKKGSKTYADRVLHQALTLLETHEPERLAADVQRKVDAVAAEAREALASVHFKA